MQLVLKFQSARLQLFVCLFFSFLFVKMWKFGSEIKRLKHFLFIFFACLSVKNQNHFTLWERMILFYYIFFLLKHKHTHGSFSTPPFPPTKSIRYSAELLPWAICDTWSLLSGKLLLLLLLLLGANSSSTSVGRNRQFNLNSAATKCCPKIFSASV